jgi:nicotinate-nucleotide pyrophosphorylase (carboxylating)
MLIIDEDINNIIIKALEEDKVKEDITTNSLFDSPLESKAIVKAKSDGILCGINLFKQVFKIIDSTLIVRENFKDGESFKYGDIIINLKGEIRAILKGERTAMNFLGHLSGIATKTEKLVKKAKGKLKILDTRKTTPCMRKLEKYAVKTGGGVNHRFNLKEMAMLKENHLIHFNSLKEAVLKIRHKNPDIFIEIEVKNIKEFKEAYNLPVQRIMLDNFSISEIEEAVKINNKKMELEVSGGVNEDNIGKIAETGVDFVSSGALTHSFKNSDFSLLVLKKGGKI